MPQNKSDGFLKVRRGFEEHLEHLTGDSVKTFMKCLFRAGFSRNVGSFKFFPEDLAASLGMNIRTLYRNLNFLEKGNYIKWERSKSRWNQSTITVLKYDVTVTQETQYGNGNGTVKEQYGNGNGTVSPLEDNINNDLQALKKVKEGERTCKKVKEEYIQVLETEEIRKEEKEPDIRSPKKEQSTCCEIFDFWNAQKITIHRDITIFRKNINAKLKIYSLEEIKETISNYSAIIKSEDHYYTHHFTLKEFLTYTNGFEKFVTENNPFDNFKNKKNNYGKTEKKYNQPESVLPDCL